MAPAQAICASAEGMPKLRVRRAYRWRYGRMPPASPGVVLPSTTASARRYASARIPSPEFMGLVRSVQSKAEGKMLLVGIDPGVTTGVATWLPAERRLRTVDSMGIVKAMQWLLEDCSISADPHGGLLVVWEDCRQHRVFGAAQRNTAALQGVGSVKRDCSIWEEFLQHHAIPYITRQPRSTRTKLTAEQFQAATGWTERSNNHARDAAMLVAGTTETIARAWLAQAQQRGAKRWA